MRRTRVAAAARAFPTSRIAPRVAHSSRRRDASSVLQASDNPGQAPSLSVNDENAEEPALSPRPKPTKKPDEPVPNQTVVRVAAFLAGAEVYVLPRSREAHRRGGDVPADGMPDGAQPGVLRALRRAPVRIRRCGVLRGGRATWWGAGMAGNEEEKDAYQRARVLTFPSQLRASRA